MIIQDNTRNNSIEVLEESVNFFDNINSIPLIRNDRLNRYIVDESYLRDYDDSESILSIISEANNISLDEIYVAIDEGYALLNPSIMYEYNQYMIKPTSPLSEDYIYCEQVLNEYENTLNEEVLDLLLLPLQEKAVDAKTRMEIIEQRIRDPERREQIVKLYREMDRIKANMSSDPNANHTIALNTIKNLKQQAKTLIKQDQADYNAGNYRNQPAPTYDTTTKSGRRSEYVANKLQAGRQKRQDLAAQQKAQANAPTPQQQPPTPAPNNNQQNPAQPQTRWQKAKAWLKDKDEKFGKAVRNNPKTALAGMGALLVGSGALYANVARRLGALNALKRKYQTLMGRQPQKRNIFARIIEKIQNAINRLRNRK